MSKKRDLETLSGLTRILKNGLWAILEVIYIFWIGATFACGGWLAGLLAILSIGAVHPLRWLWDDTDTVNIETDADARVADFRKKLLYFFAGATVAADLALIALVWITLPKVAWIVGIVLSVAATELVHFKIRAVNKDLTKLRDEIHAAFKKESEDQAKPSVETPPVETPVATPETPPVETPVA